jgi:DNA helicase TIP49 (TBP-interacting protein)
MVMNPNTSVKSVAAIPMHAMTPRISRNGLIGRCSARSGLGISALLLTQSRRASASFSFRGAHASGVLAIAFCDRELLLAFASLPERSG